MVATAHSLRRLPHTAASAFEDDVLEGLAARPKRLPAKYFYDGTGSQLFERITELNEYYPTRTEMGFLRDHAADICGDPGRRGAGRVRQRVQPQDAHPARRRAARSPPMCRSTSAAR